MAEKSFALGEGLRVRRINVGNYSWAFDIRLPEKTITKGCFRTIGDLEEDLDLEFRFASNLSHQWFTMTADGYPFNSYTSLESIGSKLTIFGAVDQPDNVIEVKIDGDSYNFKKGVALNMPFCPIDDKLKTRTSKFRLNVSDNLSQSHVSSIQKPLHDLTDLYNKLIPNTVTFRNNGIYTTGGIYNSDILECNWFTTPINGYLEGYVTERPLGLRDISSFTPKMLLRSNHADYSTTIVDSGANTHTFVDIGNSHHTNVDPLYGISSLSTSGLVIGHHEDFNLVGKKFELGFNTKLAITSDLCTLFEKKGSYKISVVKEEENHHLTFDAIKDPSKVGNMWLGTHISNKSQYNAFNYSQYFLNGLEQGSSSLPFTIHFVASPGENPDQPIFRQKSALGEDGDVHILIDKTCGMKWKNGASGVNSETVGNLPLSANSFYHFALIFDGTRTVGYVNGISIGTSSDRITSLNLGNIELGHAWIGANNSNEVFLSTARIAWICLEKGISKWSGSFNPPTTPTLISQTALMLVINGSETDIHDLTPHNHPMLKINGGLKFDHDFVSLLDGIITEDKINQWAEYSIQRDPGGKMIARCDGKNITIKTADPFEWKDSTDNFYIVPELDNSQLFEDISLYVGDYNSHIQVETNDTKVKTNLTDIVSDLTIKDVSYELQTADIICSSESATHTYVNLNDSDGVTYWSSDLLLTPPVMDLARTTSIDISFDGLLDVTDLKLTVDGVDPNDDPIAVVVYGRNKDFVYEVARKDSLTWTANSETLTLKKKLPVKNNGEMGQRIHPLVAKFTLNTIEKITVISGSPANHLGQLNLTDNKWTVDTGVLFNRYGARGVSYVNSSSNPVIGVFSGDTSDDHYYEIDCQSGNQTLKTTTGGNPGTRIHYSAVHYKDTVDKVVIFGGIGNSVYLNSVYLLNVDTLIWSALSTSGVGPTIRSHAMTCIYKNTSEDYCMLIFGGTNGTVWYNDLYELNLTSAVWRNLNPTGTPPIAREGAPSNLIYSDTLGHSKFIIYGGGGSSVIHADYNEYNINTNSWSGPITTTGNIPPGCKGGEGVLYIDEDQHLCMTIFGGKNETGPYNDRSHYCFYHPILDLATKRWKDMTPIGSDGLCDTPPVEMIFKNKRYLTWMYRGRYLYGLDPATGVTFEFNTNLHSKNWNTSHITNYSFNIAKDRLTVFGGFIGGVTSTPTRNLYTISLSNLQVEAITLSGDIPPNLGRAIHVSFIDKDNQERIFIYGGHDNMGVPQNDSFLVEPSGVCTRLSITSTGGEFSSTSLRGGVRYLSGNIPHLFLYNDGTNSLSYVDINLYNKTHSSGQLIQKTNETFAAEDVSVVIQDKIIFYNRSITPEYKELSISDMTLSFKTITGTLSHAGYWIGVNNSAVCFLSDTSEYHQYYEIISDILVNNLKTPDISTLWDNLKITLRYDSPSTSLNEIEIFTTNDIYPVLNWNPDTEPDENYGITRSFLNNKNRYVSYDPVFCGITDNENILQNVGFVMIQPQTENGSIVIDNTGHPARLAWVRVSVAAWAGSSYQVEEVSDSSVVVFGFVAANDSISSTPSDEIIFQIYLPGHRIKRLKVTTTVPSSYLTSAVFDPVGISVPMDSKLSALSYEPVSTIVLGSMSTSIAIPASKQIEINYATAVTPNMVVLSTTGVVRSKITIEGYDTGVWTVVGFLECHSELTTGRIFCTQAYQKFRLTFASAQSIGDIIYGIDFYVMYNSSYYSASKTVQCAKDKLTEIRGSVVNEVIEYDRVLPCNCVGTVSITTDCTIYSLPPNTKGTLIHAPSVNFPASYPYYASIITNIKSRLDASVITTIKEVGILASSDVRIGFSFDDRVTWHGWTGSWIVIDASTPNQLISTGMDSGTLSTIPESAWTNYLGSGKKIDVAVALHAADGAKFCYYDHVVFKVEATNNISTRLINKSDDKNFIANLDNAIAYYRPQAAITTDTNFLPFKCSNLTSGTHGDNLTTWDPLSDGFLHKLTGLAFDGNPGWVYIKSDSFALNEHVGVGWFAERQTILKVDMTSSIVTKIQDGSNISNSEGGISFSNGSSGFIVGIDDNMGGLSFLDRFDFSSSLLTRRRDDLTALYSRACCCSIDIVTISPMDGSSFFKTFTFADDTLLTEARLSGSTSGWGDQGSFSNTQKGVFFNFGTTLTAHMTDFTISESVVSDRLTLSGMRSVKCLSSSSLDYGLVIASPISITERIRIIRMDYSTETSYDERLSILPLISALYNTSSSDKDSVNSKIDNNDQSLIYVYSSGTSVCLDVNYSISICTVSPWMNNPDTGWEGYKAAGMSGVGYL